MTIIITKIQYILVKIYKLNHLLKKIANSSAKGKISHDVVD